MLIQNKVDTKITARYLPKSLSFAAALGYGLGVVGLLEAHAAVVPKSEARIALLKSLIAAMQAAEAEWVAKSYALDQAYNHRKSVFSQGLGVYTDVRVWVETLSHDPDENREDLRALLRQCDAPSHLAPSDAYVSFSALASGAEVHAAALAGVKVSAEQIAQLRAHSDALVDAADRMSKANVAQGDSSNRRDKAREDLIAALRVAERYLKRIPSGEGLAGLKKLRAEHLPVSAPKKTSA